MRIALDSNVFIADPWLRSQRLRILFNFVARTRSSLILLPSVESELAAHVRRAFRRQADLVNVAIRQAKRHELSGLPTFVADDAANESFARWERSFAKTLAALPVDRPALENAILPEALRRATERIAPCDGEGKELRDTILWLSLLSYCRTLSEETDVVFVSLNTRDFTEGEGRGLKAALIADTRTLPCNFNFFPSIDSFNKAHADRIAYLTIDWVRERLGEASVADVISSYLKATDPDPYVRVVSSEYSNYYEPREITDVHSVTLEWNDVYVWRISPTELELEIEFAVDVEVDADCALIRQPPVYYEREYNDAFPHSKTLSCFGELTGTLSARIAEGDVVELIGLEELEVR